MSRMQKTDGISRCFAQSENIKRQSLNIVYSQGLQQKIRIVESGNGYSPLADKTRIDFEIDRSEKIRIHLIRKRIGNRDCSIVQLDVCCGSGGKQTIELGANIIKESMAALYQRLIDSTATHDKYDLPYNLVQIIAEQHFPLIASDVVKLIVICYISLFSLSPGEVLIEQLDYANNNTQLSANELFENFVNNSRISANGREMDVCDFFDDIISKFKQVFSKSIKVETDYINEVLDRVRLANGFVPIISVIADGQPLSKERIKTLIAFLGMPYSYTNNGDFNPPNALSTHSDEISNDMIALIGHSAMFTYLTNLHGCGSVCSLHSLCEKTGNDKAECYDYPWKGKTCFMTVMGDILHLGEKNVILGH